MVSQLQYSGSIFTSDCPLDAEIQHRVAELIVQLYYSNSDRPISGSLGFDLVC